MPAVLQLCNVPGWLDLRGSAAQAEDAALKPSGAGWRGPYGTVPEDMQTHKNTDIISIKVNPSVNHCASPCASR